MSNTIINITGVNLREGSKVLLAAHDSWEEADIREIRSGLEAYFPGVKFVFVQGIDIIGVQDTEPQILAIEG
jgi:hypothetical protein